ncbi:hypothetical protein [Fundidesulfovibrio agrisoli]|uniref:hypothetical protein n=1 Tax=Fundidesulfovibrio agrisoli TaxID=2922717 RepID=UPI001FAC9685|nr:hypothetical protein [Fundidesulfovibrio agrisoli]
MGLAPYIRATAAAAGVFALAALFYLSLSQALLLSGLAGAAMLGLESAGRGKSW